MERRSFMQASVASALVNVSAQVGADWLIEIEVIAVIPG